MPVTAGEDERPTRTVDRLTVVHVSSVQSLVILTPGVPGQNSQCGCSHPDSADDPLCCDRGGPGPARWPTQWCGGACCVQPPQTDPDNDLLASRATKTTQDANASRQSTDSRDQLLGDALASMEAPAAVASHRSSHQTTLSSTVRQNCANVLDIRERERRAALDERQGRAVLSNGPIPATGSLLRRRRPVQRPRYTGCRPSASSRDERSGRRSRRRQPEFRRENVRR